MKTPFFEKIMKIVRRKKIGTALLTATASSMLMTACDVLKPSVSGNLMPAPNFELCIEVEPETANVIVDYSEVLDGECTNVYAPSAQVTATAEGYQDYEETIAVSEDSTHTITMTPESEEGTDDSGQ